MFRLHSRDQQTAQSPFDMPLRIIGAAILFGVAALHLVTAPDHFDEATWLGVLFIATVVGSALIAMALLLFGGAIAWAGGSAIAASTAAGFVLAATVGLGDVRETFEQRLGIPALVAELSFLVLVGVHLTLRAGHVPWSRRHPKLSNFSSRTQR